MSEYLEEFDEELLQLLLKGAEANNQTYSRAKAKTAHRGVVERWEEVFGETLSAEDYPNFVEALKPEDPW